MKNRMNFVDLPDIQEFAEAHPDFDPYTSPYERRLDEIWLPYALPEHRILRDQHFGHTPQEFEFGLQASTHHITRDQMNKLYSAILFANYQQYVFNVELTISWKYAGYIGPLSVQENYYLFIDRFKKFMKHRNTKAIYYTVFENSATHGYHSHHALHVPYAMKNYFNKWLNDIDDEYHNKSTGVRPINSSFHKDDHVYGQWKWFQYCMKGLDPRLRRGERRTGATTANYLFGVQKEEAGSLEIDRVRIAGSLGPKARKEAEYHAPHMAELPYEIRYSDTEYRRGFSEWPRSILLRQLAKLF